MSRKKIDRRHFLGRVAGGAMGALAIPTLSANKAFGQAVSANERIGVGLIGCGNLGINHHLSDMLRRQELDVIAVADPDANHREEAIAKTDGKAEGYEDYRSLLDRKDIDAVYIVTPDHWHGLCAVHACRAGKDVYCEKPLSLTVGEGKAMVLEARRYGRVFQTGSQQRSDSRFRWACDLVRNGHLGKLQRIKACIGSGPTIEHQASINPPAHLNWDLWLGPAPSRPYTEKRCHYTFRWIYDYSGGKMTDWGAHHLDIAQWALGADESGPLKVEGKGRFPVNGLYDTATHFDVHYTYPNDVTLHCTSDGENGVTFEGTEGSLFVSRERIEATPEDILNTEAHTSPIRLYHSNDHRGDWIECIRTRKRPICDVEVGHRSASVCHIGNIALRLGRPLQWNPVNESFVNDSEANRYLTKPMRQPWTLA